MKPTPKCRRGHAMKGANVRKQTNKHRRASGKITKYTTRVCAACSAYRAKRRAAKKPIRDMRKGRR